MKWNNPIVVFDLETTDDIKDREIIEIGAVLLVPTKQGDKFIGFESADRFSGLVKPRGTISPYVEDLTGICNGRATETFDAVVEKFEQWVIDNTKNIKKVRLAAWGNYFDVNVLRKEYDTINRYYPFSGTVIDVKTLAMVRSSLSNHRTDDELSVKGLVEKLDIPVSFRYHRALEDAEATALIFAEIMMNLHGGVWLDDGQYIKITS